MFIAVLLEHSTDCRWCSLTKALQLSFFKSIFWNQELKERKESCRERCSFRGSYYTVNRVCHLETRVLQARPHGQPAAENTCMTAKVVRYPHVPFTPPNTRTFLPRTGGLQSHRRSRGQKSVSASCYKSQTFKTGKTKTLCICQN